MTHNLTLIKDAMSGELYGAVVHSDVETKTVGFCSNAKEWAGWANDSNATFSEIKDSLDFTLQQEQPVKLSAKNLAELRTKLSDVDYFKVKRLAPDTAVVQYGPKHKTMGTRYVSKRVLEHKSPVSGTMSRPLASFGKDQQAAVLSYKAQFLVTQERYASLNLQVKRNRALFDPNIGPGGGWRCPDGTLYGGQITDRFGRGCGGGLTRRIGRALLQAGQRLDDMGVARDQRRLARRAQASERRAQRREALGNFFDATGDKLEAWAQALVGDYVPSKGGRRRRRGLEAGKVTRQAKGKKKRVIPDKSPAAKKKGQRKKKGTRARLADFSDRVSAAAERMAQRLVGDYKPPKKERKKKGSKKEGAASKLDSLAAKLERAAQRILGGGRRERRKKNQKPVDRKPSKKVPTGKKPSPKPKPEKKPAPKKPRKVDAKKERIKEIDAELSKIDQEIAKTEFAIMQNEEYGVSSEKLIQEVKDLEKKRAELIAERVALNSTDPVTPAKLPQKKPSGKPSGAKKNLPGKQHGGVFTKPENAKKKANEASVQEGKPLFVVQDANGKYRVVDEERLKADDSLQVVFATDQEGGIIEFTDTDSPVDEIIEEANKAAENVEKAANEHLKDLDVDALDLELKRSKTGAFLPENFDKQVLDNYSSLADKRFRETFHKERMTNWRFWQKTLGDDKIEGVEDSKTMLALIDKMIQEESEKPDANQSVLGVMRAERANFLAMWVPDEGQDEVNFYERINFVQPKRRQNIITNADLGDLIVGNKKSKKKTKPKKVSPEASIKPDDKNVPEASDMGKPTPEPDADEPQISTLDQLVSKFFGEEIDNVTAAMNKAVKDVQDSNFAEFRDKDGKIDIDKAKADLDKESDELSDEYHGIYNRILAGESVPESEVIASAQRNINFKARRAAFDEAKKQHANEIEMADKANDNTVDTEAVTPDNVPTGPSQADLVKAYTDTWNTDEDFEKIHANDLADDILQQSGLQSKIDANDFDNENSVDVYFDTLDVVIESRRKEAQDRVNKAIADEYIYDKQDPSTPNLEDDLKLLTSYDSLKARLDSDRKKAKDNHNKKLDSSDGKLSKSEALTKFFNDAKAKGFDPSKIETEQTNKHLTGIDTANLIDQLNNKSAQTDYLNQLPDNFAELSVDDQLDVIRQITGQDDEVKALGRMYRALHYKRFGESQSLTDLKTDVAAAKQMRQGGPTVTKSVADIDADIDSLKKSLNDLAQKKINGEIDALSPLERLQAEAAEATVRNRLIGQLALRLNHPDTPNSEKSPLFIRLQSEIDATRNPLGDRLRADLFPDSKPKSKAPSAQVSSGSAKPDAFDATALASTQETGEAIATHVPVGANAIYDQQTASVLVADGAPLSSVPDDFLAESIKQNIGDDKRFRMLKIDKGFNSDTTAVLDTTTGKKYIIKTEDRNHHGHIQESAAALLAQELGFGTVGVRFGSPLKDVDLPSAQKSSEGVSVGKGRTMVIEHLENLFVDPAAGPNAEKKVFAFHELPAGAQLDGRSIARLMVLDRSMNYFDRTPGNLFFVKNADGKYSAHPIDHGNAFRPWGGSSSEQSTGFVKITKGDNVNLLSLVSSLDDEGKQEFAKALIDAKKRFQKKNFGETFKKIGDLQVLSGEEKDRLKKHADFLTARQTSLDWDAMTTDVLGKLGFTPQQSQDLITPPQWSLPQSTSTVNNLESAIDSVRSDAKKPFVRIAHDGDAIEFNEIRVADVEITGAPGMVMGDGTVRSSMFTFRRRVDKDKYPINENTGWTTLQSGHVVPTRDEQTGKITFNFANKGNLPVAPNLDQYTVTKKTKVKELPDGTIIMVTESTNPKHTADQMVRVFVPDKDGKVGSSAQLIEALKQVGVEDAEPPDAAKLKETAVKTIYTTLTGKKLPKTKKIREERLQAVFEKWDIDESDIRLVAAPDGGYDIGFSPEAAKKISTKLQQQTNVKLLYHQHHGGGNPETFASGLMLSTLARYDHGIQRSGASSKQDMDNHGSGNWLYFYKSKDDNPSMVSSGDAYSVMPLDVALMRGDFRAFPNDAWGDINKYKPIEEGFAGYSPNEVDFRSGVSFGRMVTIVSSAAKRQAFLDAAKLSGRTEIDGIPIEKLVAVTGDTATIEEGFKLIRERLGLL